MIEAVTAVVTIIVTVIIFCVGRYDNRFSRYLEQRKVDRIKERDRNKATTSPGGGRAFSTSPADSKNSRNNSAEEIQPSIDTTNTSEENPLHVMATQQVQADVLEGPISEEMAEDDAYLKVEPEVMPHFNDIKNLLGVNDLENLYIALGLNHEEIEKAKAGDDVRDVAVEIVARRVLQMWRTQNPKGATRQAILTGLEADSNMLAKEDLEKKWQNAVQEQVSDVDIEDIINELGPADLDNLYYAIGLKPNDIKKAKGAALQTANVQLQAVRVLEHWKATFPKRATGRATLRNILEALEKARNKQAMETLQEKWKDEAEPDLK